MRRVLNDGIGSDEQDEMQPGAPYKEAAMIFVPLFLLRWLLLGMNSEAFMVLFGVFAVLVPALSITGRWPMYLWDDVQNEFGPWNMDTHPVAGKFLQWFSVVLVFGGIWYAFTQC